MEPEEREQAPIQFTPRSTCRHLNWNIDPEDPEISCRDCKKTLDPYWCLRQYAHHYQRVDYRLKELEAARKWQHERQEKDRQRRLLRRQRHSNIRGVVEGS